ncbi:hypothetical protein SAMN05660909_03713 [Chitinophaga terrae (ex Kim and Jung 2007)]|uniref:Uncharacterized protein n=1 Tax=Chitinophaga terrae (ex Kim and Jung 2007) TaxID=408074 RepID=A0A1H4EGW3_9BACT|nr:hypothetical protein [Chitinophaga terrae (ex Kim and Jung 2007)]GEP91626.1 hypothetical protein CTE07_32710 [Chitinophaga terrae (ex Kim and Jung 2007)]SEA84107.1 hypothetical protein SAMN05660909_03713 [Chitinophaga terrae (ex Kim and Jung 2007)]
MRHNAHLTRTGPNGSEDLFVSDSLPFFWLTLIREKDLEQLSQSSTLRISGQTAITNGQATYPFMEECLPDRLKLYQDFIAYLDKQLLPGDEIELNLLPLADGNIPSFLQSLKEELQAMEMFDIEKIEGAYSNTDITALLGEGHFPGNDAGLYVQSFAPVEVTTAEEKVPDGPSLIAAIVIILAGIIILYVPWQGYRNDDINLAVTCCLLISLIILVYGCRQLLAAVRNRMVKKTLQP